MEIHLRELVKVSNNSIITNNVLRILNKRLTHEERREFCDWLNIVYREQEIKSNHKQYPNGY